MVRAAATLRDEDDDFSQPGKLYSEVMDAEEQQILVDNIAGHVGDVQDETIKERAFQYWENVHPELGKRVREAEAANRGADAKYV
jgi:catalase